MASGGAERFVSLILPALQQHYDVSLVLMREKIDYALPESININYLENSDPYENGLLKLLKLPLLAWKYRRFCKQHHIDLSFSLMNRPNYINILAKVFGSTSKTILSERAMPSYQYGYGDLQSKINRWLIRRLYPQADHVICNSAGNRKDLIESFNVRSEKSSTIYNPVNLEMIPERNTPQEQTSTPFTFLTIGRLDEGKNHRLLIDALHVSDIPDARLLIIGSGPVRQELETLVAGYGLNDRISFLGQRDDVFEWLSQSDCFVFGSNHEGFPNVLLEALACGLPIISTDCPSGPREILAPGTELTFILASRLEFAEYGILSPLNDADLFAKAMQEIYHNSNTAERYRKAARIRAKDFEITAIAKQLISILDY
jgi:N-acetylgalactosamine-N,N'-diacetylbacillosaminyl-diphospho-undecaprenol 4-alpha-N-acetylgalactosaminyltransferase